MSTTRRTFLCRAARGSALLAVGHAVPGLFAPRVLAEGSAPGERTSPRGRVLVVLELAGGNDGLNTVVPLESDVYRRARPVIGLAPESCLGLSDEVGLHPELTGLRSLYDDGLVAIVGGVGYPRPDRSHFRSREIWHTARPGATAGAESTGWLGRALDQIQIAAPTPLRLPAVCFGREVSPALQAMRLSVPALTDPRRFGLPTEGAEGRILRSLLAGTCEAGAGARGNRRSAPSPLSPVPASSIFSAAALARDPLGAIRRQTRTALLTARDMHRLTETYHPQARYPETPVARGLRTVAQMLLRGFGLRVCYLAMGGFDTHAAQPRQHARLLRALGDGLRAFVSDLRAQRLEQEVVVLVFSEFGRRVAENASAGTDHGTAGPVLLVGTGVKPGLYRAAPALEQLERGDVPYSVDFRRIYQNLLGEWLGVDSARVLGGRFAPLSVVRG